MTGDDFAALAAHLDEFEHHPGIATAPWESGIAVTSHIDEVRAVYMLARQHLPDPVRVDVTYWDDGTVTVRAKHFNGVPEVEKLRYESEPGRPDTVEYIHGTEADDGRMEVYDREPVATLVDDDDGGVTVYAPPSSEVDPADASLLARLRARLLG